MQKITSFIWFDREEEAAKFYKSSRKFLPSAIPAPHGAAYKKKHHRWEPLWQDGSAGK